MIIYNKQKIYQFFYFSFLKLSMLRPQIILLFLIFMRMVQIVKHKFYLFYFQVSLRWTKTINPRCASLTTSADLAWM